jgi:flavin reductase (DIM6/NTAB) family NADH-FMN oxidoreductase RutF
MELRPEDVPVRDRYKLMIGCIVPRPIAFVSTISPDGKPNLAPFSFFNGVGSDPMTLLFCPSNKPDGSEKDTLRNCKPRSEGGTGEFVVNAAIESYAREMAACGEPLEYGDSEWDLTGIAPAPSRRVKPARVARSPWAFECETVQIVRTNPGAPVGGNIVIGRVVHIHVDDALVDERFHVDADRLAAIGRMGGFAYTLTRDRFEMPPTREALAIAPPVQEKPRD